MLIPHRLPGEGLPATVLARPNRFLARCRLDDGREVDAHVPDRGRLLGIVEPGARARLYAADAPTRKTAFTLLVCHELATGTPVGIDPAGANLRVRALLERGLVPGIEARSFRSEVAWGTSRFDFRVETPEGPTLVEVKSVGAAKDGVGLFPDAPTERGVRHLNELARFVDEGHGHARVLFVAQRGDVGAIRLDGAIDPQFAATARKVRDRVPFLGLAFEVHSGGFLFQGPVEVLE
jgi:sugar fermentation stimulation protein A